MKRDEQDGRFDLSALDPFADSAHADAFVRGVLDRSAAELSRRRRRPALERPWTNGGVFGVMAGWARPALAAAALSAVLSAALLGYERTRQEASSGLIEALSVPAPVDEWLVAERPPATADVLVALERGSSW